MERTSNSVAVYGGNKPYIFISYSHRDTDRVLPVISAMEAIGYRVWFDQGIEAGSEWSNNIANHLRYCGAFVSFVSENSMASENCLDEIAFAKSNNKPSLMIFLKENVELPEGVEMQTARFQRLLMLEDESADDFVKRLEGAEMLSSCRGEDAYAHYVRPGHAGVPSDKYGRKKNKMRLAVKISAAVLAVALICTVGILLIDSRNSFEEPEYSDVPAESSKEPEEPSDTGTPETPPETKVPETSETPAETEQAETPAETEPPRPEIEMSDDLADFTFILDGRVYALPMYYTELIEDGWQVIAGAGEAYSETLVRAHNTANIRLIKEIQQISVRVYNPSGDSRAAIDCIMMGIEVMKDGNADFSIAKGISIGSSENEVKDAFGEPVYVNFGPNKYSIYLDKDPDKLSVFIDYYDDKCAGIRLFAAGKLKNEPTDTNTAVPPCVTEYEAPAELGNNIKSGRFELFDGMIVQLPAPLSLFLDNGWTTDADLSLYLMSGKTRGCILSKDGVTIRVYATNVGEWQNIFRNAMVTEILVVQSADEVRTVITLPGGVCTGATFDELEDILPQDSFRVYETDGYLVYDHTPSYKDLTAVVGEVQFKFDKESTEKRCCEIYIRYNFR